jgi:hypothetical protein
VISLPRTPTSGEHAAFGQIADLVR